MVLMVTVTMPLSLIVCVLGALSGRYQKRMGMFLQMLNSTWTNHVWSRCLFDSRNVFWGIDVGRTLRDHHMLAHNELSVGSQLLPGRRAEKA